MGKGEWGREKGGSRKMVKCVYFYSSKYIKNFFEYLLSGEPTFERPQGNFKYFQTFFESRKHEIGALNIWGKHFQNKN